MRVTTALARAEYECSPPGVEAACSSSTFEPSGYNVFYSLDKDGMDETGGDRTIRLSRRNYQDADNNP